MKRVIAVIVLVCMVGVAIGYISDKGFNQISGKNGVVFKVRENLCIKKRIMIKEYTKDICDYRDSFGDDNMVTYSLFKVKKLVDNKFGLGVQKIAHHN